MLAAAMARHLQSRGVQRGSCVAVDLPNCPTFMLLILAAAYGNFTIVALNNRLTQEEKTVRLLELERGTGARSVCRIDEQCAQTLFERTVALLTGDGRTEEGTGRPSFMTRTTVAMAQPRSTRGLGRASTGRAARRRRDETMRQDAMEEVLHFAERAAHVFDLDARALVMFTSGTTGKPKAVPLTWDHLCRASEASNATLHRSGEGMWQVVLPFFHIGGFQIIVRSLLGGIPFILYRRFDPARVLSDGARCHATHISVVDKMLQDLLNADNDGVLQTYRCILLGGGAANPHTLSRATTEGVRVFASYGMTETSSQIAHAQVTPSFDGGLRLLPGYEARIIDPDADGFGRLAVRGPGVFDGYLNARAAYTVDGFFLTGDTAAIVAGRLRIRERTADMFISGGENVYPAEIRDKLMRIPGVADAHVFGASDATWGRRPVAFVERMDQGHDATPQQVAALVQTSLRARLSRLYWPRHVCVLDEFPRTGIGKVDRGALEALYEQRIEIVRVTLYRIQLPFLRPFKTAKGTLRTRESLIVEVEDHAGRIGLGEGVAFSTDWYLPETLDQDVRVLCDSLAPLVTHEVYLHPSEVSASLASCSEAVSFPLAQGAIEPALWDLYGKIVEKPLWDLIGGDPAKVTLQGMSETPEKEDVSAVVATGAVVGMASPRETVAAVHRCVEAGYRRVKLKVAPGSLPVVRAVCDAYPDLMISLDANQSFTEHDIEELRALDTCGAAWIEEPLNPRLIPSGGPTDVFARLVRLQRIMRTPLCLDESIAHPRDVVRALQHPELRCYALKIGKMGGVQPSLEFARAARSRGLAVWMGGMYDTGISKRLHAAFETLPGIDAPGDIGATARYFRSDVTDPPYVVDQGCVVLNGPDHPYGLGCDLNRLVLADVLTDRIVVER